MLALLQLLMLVSILPEGMLLRAERAWQGQCKTEEETLFLIAQ